jgi:hypothetical protein
MIRGIMLWHRMLNNSDKASVDVDWILCLRSAWLQIMSSRKSGIDSMKYVDPFMKKMDSSPSKPRASIQAPEKEDYFLSFHLFLSYLNEKIIYDLRNFSKASHLSQLSKAYFELYSALTETMPFLVDFRSACFQILSFGLNLIKCHDHVTSDLSQRIRASTLACLAELFSVSDSPICSDKRRCLLESETKESCSALLLEDLERLANYFEENCSMFGFSPAVVPFLNNVCTGTELASGRDFVPMPANPMDPLSVAPRIDISMTLRSSVRFCVNLSRFFQSRPKKLQRAGRSILLLD